MSIHPDPFRHEYDLGALQRIRPMGQDFEMLVTPRYRSHFLDDRYEAFMATLIGAMSRSHRLFVDVGAHYGFFSLLAATKNPDIEVMAFEPVPETHEILMRNFASNGLEASAALRRAVSSRPGRARFNVSVAADNCGFFPHPVAPPIHQIDVDTVILDQVLAARAPCATLVKIDTDGHELAVLEGMAETLDRFPDIRLFVELNPKMQRLAGHDPEHLLADLDRRGFHVFLLDESSGRQYRVRSPSDWTDLMASPVEYVNLYCCRKESSISVCFVSQSAALAGAERSLVELVSELVEDHGAMCTVLVPGEGPLVGQLRASGAASLAVPYEWWCDLTPEAGGPETRETDLSTRLTPSILALLGEPYRELRRIDPDVLVTQTIAIPWGACLAEILGKPHVWHLCEHGDPNHDFRFLLPRNQVIDVIRSSSDHIFTASESIRESFFPGEGSSAFCTTLYRHLDLRSEPEEYHPSTLPGRSGAVRIGAFGSLCPAKGQDLLIQAMARLAERGRWVDLFLVGPHHADFPRRLSELIQTHGLQGMVHLPGFIEDVYPEIASMDVVVVGSRREGFGRVAVEAMFLGRPVVYPRLGGPGEYMLDGVTGLGYTAGDVEGMADAIDRLVLDPGLRETLGEQARTFALATFTRERYGGAAVRTLRRLRGLPRSPEASRRSWWWSRFVPDLLKEARAAERRELEAELSHLEDAHRLEKEEAVRRLHLIQHYLDATLGSATWRVALWLRWPFDLLAPHGSRRRGLLKDLVLGRRRVAPDPASQDSGKASPGEKPP